MSCTVAAMQLQASFVKYLVFQVCVWVKSLFMKLGLKHDKVRAVLAPTLYCAAEQCRLCVLPLMPFDRSCTMLDLSAGLCR